MRSLLILAAAIAAATGAAAAQEHGGHAEAPAAQAAEPEHAHEAAPPETDHDARVPGEAAAQEQEAHSGEPAGRAAEHDHEDMRETPAQEADHDAHVMTGALGLYPATREASGTSWQPDATPHFMVHAQRGDWMLMSHVLLNGVHDWQGGPRGDEMAFVSGMVMGAARRDFSGGALNLRAMLSPDPFMGKRGYPLLLAAGETANGIDPLVDRQHPHDLFMELSASYAHWLSSADSVFIYAGLPGEPAFGPPAFMHRLSAMDSPEAPITHHWLDSTHITFGVLTAGWTHENWKLDASGFRGREPDEHRFDVEPARLDSFSARVSWNPGPHWSIQASWADLESPEQLEPDEDETRFSTSAIYTRPLANGGWWSTTAAFAVKDRSDGVSLDAWLLESAVNLNRNLTLFARAEWIETDELGEVPHGPVEDAAKLSIGAVRDWRVGPRAAIGLGALASRAFVSDALAQSYDGDQNAAMAFVRLIVQ